MPRLSVYLTNYNHADCVEKAIKAIVGQSRLPDEFIIQDDGSTDNSVNVIMPFVHQYPFIRFVQNETNLGAIPAMQKASSYATGDYIYGAASDDWVLPGFFEKAMNLASLYPHAGIICGDIYEFLADTSQIIDYQLMWSDNQCYLSPDEVADIIAGQAVPGQAVMLRRDAFIETGGFRTDIKWHSDWFFNMVTAFRYGAIYIPEFVAVETARKPGAFCFEGSRNHHAQTEVLTAIVKLLTSDQFKDVYPRFARSGVLYPFSFSAVVGLMQNEELWNTQSLLLLQHSLHQWNCNLTSTNQLRNHSSLNKKIHQTL